MDDLIKPPQEMSISEIFDFFQSLGNKWRSKVESDKIIEKEMSYIEKESAEFLKFIPFSVNNQSIYNMAQIRFVSNGSCIGFTHWHSGGQVHIVAALEPEKNTRASVTNRHSLIKNLVGPIDSSAAFDRIDTDKSGYISKIELSSALSRAGLKSQDIQMEELMEIFDADNSEIDKEKFKAAFYASRLSGGVDVYVPVPKSKSNKGIKFYESIQYKDRLLELAADFPAPQ